MSGMAGGQAPTMGSSSESPQTVATRQTLSTPEFPGGLLPGYIDGASTPASPATMRFYHVYAAAPRTWDSIGQSFAYLDVIGSSLFLIGSICFTMSPLLTIWIQENPRIGDYIFLFGVILFSIAKVFIEARALYADLWHHPIERMRRGGWTYHVGVLIFLFGSITFVVSIVTDLQGAKLAPPLWGLISSVFFLVGSAFFVANSFVDGVVRWPIYSPHNSSLYGAIALGIGSAVYIASEVCALPTVASSEQTISYLISEARPCNHAYIEWTSFFGGVFFVLGSAFLLAFSLHELLHGPDLPESLPLENAAQETEITGTRPSARGTAHSAKVPLLAEPNDASRSSINSRAARASF